MEAIFQLGLFLGLLFVGFYWGQRREKSHYQQILDREKSLQHIPVRPDHKVNEPVQEAFLVMGNVVIANDYFKSFVAGIKNIIGGRLTAYESLMDRARREAILRMKEEAFKKGAQEIVHCRIDTSFIDQLGVEIIAQGTAIKR